MNMIALAAIVTSSMASIFGDAERNQDAFTRTVIDKDGRPKTVVQVDDAGELEALEAKAVTAWLQFRDAYLNDPDTDTARTRLYQITLPNGETVSVYFVADKREGKLSIAIYDPLELP